MIHARSDYQERFGEDPADMIKANEPVFLVRAQDKYFINVLAHYRSLIASDMAMEHEQKLTIVKQLDAHIETAREWQTDTNNLVKTPDVPPLGVNRKEAETSEHVPEQKPVVSSAIITPAPTSVQLIPPLK